MIDWGVAASLATAAGTLVLAVATFASTRSANRAARTAERALLQGLRPILLPSRWTDGVQKIHYMDDHWLVVPGGRAVLEVTPDVAYLGLAVRDVGQGPAVIDAWDLPSDRGADHRPLDRFHRLGRDLYVPAGDPGFVQIAVRDPNSPAYALLSRAFAAHDVVWVDVLYADVEGSQHFVTRFALTPAPHPDPDAEADGRTWALSESRHWNLGHPDPRR
ncbi:MAG: hypothetical protein WAM30_05740 [Candidatus Dormiibacterota bacterium]